MYRPTADFPRAEVYGLTSQICRAGASIPANIAAGCGRGSNADLSRSLQTAIGSANELEYQPLLAYDLSLLDPDAYQQLTREVLDIKRMLTSFIQKLIADS